MHYSVAAKAISKTELIIVATVNLVTPVDPDKVKLPGFHGTSDMKDCLISIYLN